MNISKVYEQPIIEWTDKAYNFAKSLCPNDEIHKNNGHISFIYNGVEFNLSFIFSKQTVLSVAVGTFTLGKDFKSIDSVTKKIINEFAILVALQNKMYKDL